MYRFEKSFSVVKKINSSFVSDTDIAAFIVAWENSGKYKVPSKNNRFVVKFAKEVFNVEVDAEYEEYSYHTDIITLISMILMITALCLIAYSIYSSRVILVPIKSI